MHLARIAFVVLCIAATGFPAEASKARCAPSPLDTHRLFPADLGIDPETRRALGPAARLALRLRGDGRFLESAEAFAAAGESALADGALPTGTRLLGAAAECAVRAGAFRRALAFAERRLAVLRTSGTARERATALADLAEIYGEVGDRVKTLALHERALDLRRRAGAPSDVASSLRALGEIHRVRGDRRRARRTLEEALAISVTAGDRRGVAEARLLLGRCARSDADAEGARRLHALAFYAAREASDVRLVARGFEALAQDCVDRWFVEDALDLYDRALVLHGEAGDTGAQVRGLARMADVRLRAGDPAGALALHARARGLMEALDAIDLRIDGWSHAAAASLAGGRPAASVEAAREATTAVPRVVCGLSEAQGAAAREKRSGAFETGCRASLLLGDPALVLSFLEAGRAGTLLELLAARDAVRRAPIPGPLLAEEETCRAAEARALDAHRRAVASGVLSRIRKTRARLARARTDLKDVLERIQRLTLASTRVEVPSPPSLAAIQGSLEPAEAAVLYGALPGETVAVVVRAPGARIVRLGPMPPIEEALRTAETSEDAAEAARALDALRRLLVEPLDLGEGIQRVLVSPDGPLHYVPFAALLGEREAVAIPSAATYRRLLPARERRGKGVLAVGSPAYASTGTPQAVASVRRGVHLTPLPASGEEARAIGDVVLIGAEATEAGLRFAVRRRPRWRAVHLACHGVIDPERPTLSALALTPEGDDDGFLTALDVFRLRIEADLVVLSACESGKGRIFRGEGALGLMRAFLFAGAPRVLVSLSEVDDEATAALMRRFHELWAEGFPAARALREAQAEIRSRPGWRHPRYWAFWTLWGLP